MSSILFTNVKVFDGSGSSPFDAEVLVEGNRIRDVKNGRGGIVRPPDANIINGGGNTLMPGLVEPHSHLCFTSSMDRIVKEWMPPPERHQFIAAHNAKTLLDHGFTSAFSGGATRPGVEVAIRDEIAGGWIPGPRLKASSFERTVSGDRIEFAPGADATRQFVRDMIALGVDSMKFILSGRGALEPAHWAQINYGDEELAIASAMARDAGVFTTCHAYMPESVKLAVRHGFHCLYHCNFADEEALDMIEARKADIFVAPAFGILVADANDRFADRDPAAAREAAAAIGTFEAIDGQRRVIPELHRRGVRVLPGGDYGFPHNPHGRNARDIELFASELGFTPGEALRAATQYGGEMMGMGRELGLVRSGYLADLLLVQGNPLDNLACLQDRANLLMIMKDGGFHKAPPAAHA